MPGPSRRPTRKTREIPGHLPDWIAPQLSKLVQRVPAGTQWAHEIKFDGYRLHARIENGKVRLLTRTGLDWTAKYGATAAALRSLPVRSTYLDGELCGVRPDGTTSFSLIQAATDAGSTASLVYYLFDVLYLEGEELVRAPLAERKGRLAPLLADPPGGLQYSDHVIGQGEAFHRHACVLGLEGIVSKRLDAPYVPGDRGLWLKTKCLNREEFVVVGWTDPEGSRPHIGALLLGYCAPDGKLTYAGRVGTGITGAELARLRRLLGPLATREMPLAAPPPRTSRFGSPLELSRVHWVRPELVVEVSYLSWTDDKLLRQVVYQGVREDKPASSVARPIPG